jgi:hypothetical protein
VPVRAYLELQQHNDALFRELELIDVELRARPAPPTPLPERLVRLVEEFRARFPGVSDGYREPVAAAAARGESTVDLDARLTPASIPAARAYVELLERADELCRAGEMLTPPPSEEVRLLRRWFVEQLTAQLLHHASPTPPGPASARR